MLTTLKREQLLELINNQARPEQNITAPKLGSLEEIPQAVRLARLILDILTLRRLAHPIVDRSQRTMHSVIDSYHKRQAVRISKTPSHARVQQRCLTETGLRVNNNQTIGQDLICKNFSFWSTPKEYCACDIVVGKWLSARVAQMQCVHGGLPKTSDGVGNRGS